MGAEVIQQRGGGGGGIRLGDQALQADITRFLRASAPLGEPASPAAPDPVQLACGRDSRRADLIAEPAEQPVIGFSE